MVMIMYKIEIFYSEEDEGYIATVPELPGCSAFGETEAQAQKEIRIAQDLWLKAAKCEGRDIQRPKSNSVPSSLFSGAVVPTLR